jgi:hypothetical protein
MSLLLALAVLQASPVWIGKFTGSGQPPAPWRSVRVGKAKATSYQLATIAGSGAIEARVDNSMALLARPIRVDLAQTPMLCWQWRIDAVVPRGDIRTKRGNDFAARVYVAFAMPASALSASAKMKLSIARSLLGMPVPDAALTYVWDKDSRIGLAMRSPYSDRQQLIVAESGNAHARQWVSERADVAADFNRAFEGKPGRPVELAIAADGDNTRAAGRAAFSNLHFVGRDQQCMT